MKILVDKAYRDGYAVPSFCAWNAEVMAAVLRVAERLRAPVILMQGPGEFPVLSVMAPSLMAAVARAVAGSFDIPAALHLDHGDTLPLVQCCLDAGYTSVMLDCSTRPLKENSDALREVVRLSRPRGVTVEGELGHVGKADESSAEAGGESTFTDPSTARAFVEATGVDALAVSIGNKHGFYKGEPRLDFSLLSALHDATGIPLVLHGGTGISPGDIEKAMARGIAKVNVASELVHGMRADLAAQWAAGKNLWSPIAIGAAMVGLEKTIEKWIHVTGAAGRL